MLFINTRPADRAQALTQCLVQAHFQVLDLPLLALQPLPYNAQLQQQFTQLAAVQAIVVVSPTAVEVGLAYLQRSQVKLEQLQHIEWIAVGKKTAAVLAQHGITASVPEVDTSEGMLQLPLFTQRPDLKAIAFWRGIGGRAFMMQQCQQKNIAVVNMLLYARCFPESSKQQFQAFLTMMQREPQPFVMNISSEASWCYWLDLCESHSDILQKGHYLVLGTRLYQILLEDRKSKNFCFNITSLENLEENTVLQTLSLLQRSL